MSGPGARMVRRASSPPRARRKERSSKFKLTTTGQTEKIGEAHSFGTVGDLIDFTDGWDENGNDKVVLRFRAANVHTIERVEG